jgi:hypothetical protein
MWCRAPLSFTVSESATLLCSQMSYAHFPPTKSIASDCLDIWVSLQITNPFVRVPGPDQSIATFIVDPCRLATVQIRLGIHANTSVKEYAAAPVMCTHVRLILSPG